jgi:hypothetical protein
MKSIPLTVLFVVACSSASDQTSESNEAVKARASQMDICKKRSVSDIPADGRYYLTAFGGNGESQPMACTGASQKTSENGSWYYAADMARFQCGTHLRVEGSDQAHAEGDGKCVVVEVADCGPNASVERSSKTPVLDASPLVAEKLFPKYYRRERGGIGWKDRLVVKVTPVDPSTPLGECAAETPGPDPDPDPDTPDDGAEPAPNEGEQPVPHADCSHDGEAMDPGWYDTNLVGFTCQSDGDCNPCRSGSGLVCEGGQCSPGCVDNAQCHGDDTCDPDEQACTR